MLKKVLNILSEVSRVDMSKLSLIENNRVEATHISIYI